jgi:RNA polymerase sigma-70 factor (ECF subfamily)
VATLIRVLGDFDLAEDAVQDAFAQALRRWPRDGIPRNPGAWITTTARNAAIDRLRRESRGADKVAELEALRPPSDDNDSPAVDDDRLRLIFTCCHPALAPEARVALTLRTLGGLTTAEIARAFLVAEPTMAQRLVRAKRKIASARIPYVVPAEHDLPDRLRSVLSSLYLIFNEGYLASGGERAVRSDLCAEAIRLARVLADLMPDEPEAIALLGLMLLHDSRRDARVDAGGRLVLLDDQDRSLWHRDEIAEGLTLVARAHRLRADAGSWTIEAAIAAEHAREQTDWPRIVELYDALLAAHPSPVVELNRAVAIAMADGPERGLALIDDLVARGELTDYHLLHSAAAELLRRAGRPDEAARAYRHALGLASNAAERQLLERRLAELTSVG